MIIIYNISGLILGAFGVLVGMVLAVLTGFVGFGCVVIAAVWVAGGIWWRNSSPPVKRAYPALFFIPLPFLAAPVALFGFLLGGIELFGRLAPRDPRADAFRADEEMLKHKVASGDTDLSEKILSTLEEATSASPHASDFHVFTRKTPNGVLVLVKTADLKKYANDERRTMLESIATVVRADEKLADQPLYIGVKGRITYGAILTPPAAVEIDSVVNDSKLFGVYGTGSADRAIDASPATETEPENDARPTGDSEPAGDSKPTTGPEATNSQEPATEGENRADGEKQDAP